MEDLKYFWCIILKIILLQSGERDIFRKCKNMFKMIENYSFLSHDRYSENIDVTSPIFPSLFGAMQGWLHNKWLEKTYVGFWTRSGLLQTLQDIGRKSHHQLHCCTHLRSCKDWSSRLTNTGCDRKKHTGFKKCWINLRRIFYS